MHQHVSTSCHRSARKGIESSAARILFRYLLTSLPHWSYSSWQMECIGKLEGYMFKLNQVRLKQPTTTLGISHKNQEFSLLLSILYSSASYRFFPGKMSIETKKERNNKTELLLSFSKFIFTRSSKFRDRYNSELSRTLKTSSHIIKLTLLHVSQTSFHLDINKCYRTHT